MNSLKTGSRAGVVGLVVGLSCATSAFEQRVDAGLILSPDSVIANTMGEFNSNYAAELMLDQSGLSAGFTSGVSDFATYIASGPTHATSEGGGGVSWISQSGRTTGNIDFDLGATYSIAQIVLWQGVAGNNASVMDFDILTSTDAAFTSPLLVGSFTAAEGLPDPEIAQVFDLIDSSAQYVRLQVNSNYGNSLTGLGELAFDVVPGPGALALFGLCGLIGTRRRRA